MTKVLYVEDHEAQRDIMVHVLEMYGYEVDVACNGEDGVEKARQWRPDVVLMDIRMPGWIDGVGAIRQLRNDSKTATIPIIVVSAWVEHKEQALKAGANMHFTKPAPIGELIAAISRPPKETNLILPMAKVARPEREETSEAPKEDGTSPLGFKLTMLDSGGDVEVSLTPRGVTIGRLDPASGSFPEVDLTDYGGVKKGISRHHARITRRGREIVVEDLGSMNGTFVNGKKVIPYHPRVLRNGNELQLGELKLRVSFT
jgi:CheY-like chemotaxis protein